MRKILMLCCVLFGSAIAAAQQQQVQIPVTVNVPAGCTITSSGTAITVTCGGPAPGVVLGKQFPVGPITAAASNSIPIGGATVNNSPVVHLIGSTPGLGNLTITGDDQGNSYAPDIDISESGGKFGGPGENSLWHCVSTPAAPSCKTGVTQLNIAAKTTGGSIAFTLYDAGGIDPVCPADVKNPSDTLAIPANTFTGPPLTPTVKGLLIYGTNLSFATTGVSPSSFTHVPVPNYGTGSAYILGAAPGQAYAPTFTEDNSDGSAIVVGVNYRPITSTCPPPPAVTSITVIPDNSQVAVGDQLQFKAVDQFGIDVTSKVVWSSSDLTVATIDANGSAKGLIDGVVTISATDPNAPAPARSIPAVRSRALPSQPKKP